MSVRAWPIDLRRQLWILPEVRRALAEIHYNGYVTTELEGGDAAYLKDVSARVDRFLAGEKPVAK